MDSSGIRDRDIPGPPRQLLCEAERRTVVWTNALEWAKGRALSAPVSDHHWRAVNELWPMLRKRGIGLAVEVGAGEPPYLTARMLKDNGVVVLTSGVQVEEGDYADVHCLPWGNKTFDLVVARHVLEHVLCPYVALMEMARVTRQYLLVVVPWDSEKTLNWPDHLWHLSRAGWERIFNNLNLTIVEFQEGNHTEAGALWDDREWRYLLQR